MFLILSGLCVHIVFLASVFDIYFKSPVVHGITPQSTPPDPPAKRLVLMVADGLRADSFYETPDLYLRSIIQNRGTWGVSHTRVPTESRPGHVALIAGLYEDPSAVAKGWKENPVEFDSVFNESRYTWSWGSPDILPMFAKGASGNHVYIDSYNPSAEDFSGKKSTSKLDTWVFRKVEGFLKYAKTDATLNAKLHEEKIVFFLHLLGLDTAGHTHKPHSVEYKENIHVVDKGIKRVEELIEEFYQHDKQTAYIFTADHGMTDWGSHGAGDKSETETPLIAWGAGVSGPRPSRVDDPPSPFSWSVEHVARYDVNQADIAPLMASLIGVPVPVNSVGVLPQDYFNVSEHQLAELVFTNARQMAAQYKKKQELIKAGTLSWLYKEFPGLSESKEDQLLNEIKFHITVGRYNESIALSRELIELSLLGLDYYQNYYQSLLLTCITLAILGWIAWLFQSLISDGSSNVRNISLLDSYSNRKKLLALVHARFCVGGYGINIAFLVIIILTIALLALQVLPLQFYVYCLLPEFIWWAVVRSKATFIEAFHNLRRSMGLKKLSMLLFFHILGVELLVLSFFYRFILSIAVLGLALWPVLTSFSKPVRSSLLLGWMISSLFLAVFPLLPVIGREPNTWLVCVSGCMFILLAIICAWTLASPSIVEKKLQTFSVLLVQPLMLVVAIWNLVSVARSIDDKQGLLQINQIISWSLLAISLCLPLMSSRRMLLRLYSVDLSLIVPFLLLSASHEGLFILALMMNMFCWLLLEHHCADSAKNKLLDFAFGIAADKSVKERCLSSRDFRRAYFFFFYIFLSFFGVGNIASINSFDPTWVRCFLTVFSPFIMTILIMWKIMIPFLAVSCTFRALNIIVQAPTEKLFIIVLIFCEAMCLHFLHLVTNRGSWLDIGTSISHYVIVQTTVLFLVLLYGLAIVLTDISLLEAARRCNFVRSKYEESSLSLESGGGKQIMNTNPSLQP
ncbi:GPI ethanolamine phosphate transferase 1 isoform X2 [Periplaneta americana]|uniref:GPI ethanolamine phosphate transferase 1 isoform X2 n=1 Tax=Periplaneta americana TaxID=6978 RepID=UPI0037E7B0A7